MSSLNQHEKLIRKLTRDHNATIKRLEKARDVCSIGTNSYRQYEESIASERRKHTEQLVAFGVVPQNLGNLTKTEFIYVAHCASIPANKAELDKLLHGQLLKASKDLHYDAADEATRAKLEEEYPNAK
jgi:hypothetical protein